MKEEDYIKKWLDNSLSNEEKELFARREYLDVDEWTSKALDHFRAPEYNTDEQFAYLNAAKAKSAPMKRTLVLLKLAAVFIMLLGFVSYFASDFLAADTEHLSSKLEITLPDASNVVLNTHSKLTYDEDNWLNKRQAFLEGEGFFEATKGTQFDIKSRTGVVSVLGTSFNIKDRENYFEVKCYDGLVRVKVNKEEFLLSMFQAYRMIDGVGEKIEFKEKVSPSWIEGESSFRSVPYIQVIEELERQYGVSIAYENINTQLSFSGKFTQSDLTLALESITKPLNIGFEVAGRQVRLTSEIK